MTSHLLSTTVTTTITHDNTLDRNETITNHSCLASSVKRKRPSELHVRFCTQPEIVIYTYSQSDYDRSGLFPEIPAIHNNINTALFNKPKHTTTTPTADNKPLIFTLSINFVNTPIMKHSAQKLKLNSHKRPKLSIDTSNLEGPLYFTNMTTNHQKKRAVSEEANEEPLDMETRENTRRNSLPLIC